jgi:ubiquinone/menaquinone biosynthesis C-methylase UbiE/uncharacterized protein YbaR (Trm112 family)
MYKNILEIMICPNCGEKLELNPKNEVDGEIIEGTLTCINNHKWIVEEGIINFESEEQSMVNNWSELYAQKDYNEIDKLLTERTPQIQLNAMEVAKAELINSIKEHHAKKVLDIATGRGLLLTRLVESFGSNIDLVCVDLSFEVLKYDRIKAKKINPNIKINYIACDATKMPFLSNSFDLTVSFFGISNMGNFSSEGINEGVRVSQNGLVNVGPVIKDDNPKIDELNKLLIENGYDFKVDSFTESNFYKMHKTVNNYNVEVNNVFEGIAEKNEDDLIPVEGEWFAIAMSKTTRA